MNNNIFKLFSLVAISIFFSMLYSCSTSKSTINKKNIIIGENYSNKSNIRADEFIFRENIYDFYIDTTKQNITLKSRGFHREHHLNSKGSLFQFDLSLQNLKWEKSFDYKKSNIFQEDSIVIISTDKKKCSYNPENGKKQWKLNLNLFTLPNSKTTALGHNSKFDLYDYMYGIDLEKGKKYWERKIDLDYGFNEILLLNDSTALVVANGLHTYNLKNGIGWDIKETVGKKDYARTIVANALGITLGLYTGIFVFTPGYPIIYDIASNALLDNSFIYWASKEKIMKLDYYGNSLWDNSLPEDIVSRSKIFISGNIVFMINFGYAYSNFQNKPIIYGQPFIAGFDINSGERVFYNLINDYNNPIIDNKIDKNELLLFSPSKISKYDINTGVLIDEKSYNFDSSGYLSNLINKNIFIKSSSGLVCLNDVSKNNYCILTHKNKVIQLNDQLEVLSDFDYLNTYIEYLNKNNYRFVGNSLETFVLDKNERVVAKIKASNKAVLVGTKLYDKHKNAMLVIELKDIINN